MHFLQTNYHMLDVCYLIGTIVIVLHSISFTPISLLVRVDIVPL